MTTQRWIDDETPLTRGDLRTVAVIGATILALLSLTDLAITLYREQKIAERTGCEVLISPLSRECRPFSIGERGRWLCCPAAAPDAGAGIE